VSFDICSEDMAHPLPFGASQVGGLLFDGDLKRPCSPSHSDYTELSYTELNYTES
jgi:hypothetical protein